ncbi:MAG: hypothetical protein FD123_1917 [Bacteroidetes bacterium]|nr:MAG: hypothetical protein FD123_1917 [Bacteroidota bacterium]
MGFLSFLTPKDKKFFPLFEKAAENLLKTSDALIVLTTTNSVEERAQRIREIEHLEHAGDNITHLIYNELGKNFITPFDREDIHDLASAIDDIIDFIHGSAKRIDLYKIDEMGTAIPALARCIRDGAVELNVALKNLNGMKDIDAVKEACVKMNSLENEADDIFNKGIAELFEKEKDAIKVIKYKEVLSALETATDKCEDAANVIHTIIVKQS